MAVDGGLSGDLKFAAGIIILLIAAMWADMKRELNWCRRQILRILSDRRMSLEDEEP